MTIPPNFKECDVPHLLGRKKEMTVNFINRLWNRKFHMLELGFKERKNLKIQLKSLETHRLRIWTQLASEFLEVLN